MLLRKWPPGRQRAGTAAGDARQGNAAVSVCTICCLASGWAYSVNEGHGGVDVDDGKLEWHRDEWEMCLCGWRCGITESRHSARRPPNETCDASGSAVKWVDVISTVSTWWRSEVEVVLLRRWFSVEARLDRCGEPAARWSDAVGISACHTTALGSLLYN